MREKPGYQGKIKISIILLSFLLTVMQLAGYHFSMKYQTTVHTSMFFSRLGILKKGQYILVGLVAFVVWNLLLSMLFRFLDNRMEFKETKARNRLWLLAPALFLCWLPSLFACYPGFFNYDAIGQLPQALYDEVPYSTHHPLLHTLIMGKIMKAGYMVSGGNLQIGLLFYSLFQTGACSLVFCVVIRFIWKVGQKKWLVIAAFCYYALFPVNVMFALSTTKDVLFSLVLLLCVLQIYDMYRNADTFWKNPFKVSLLVILAVIMCLLRNNGIYAVLLLAVCSFLFSGLSWKRNLLLYGCIALLYFVSSNGLAFFLHAESGSKAEAFCVPMQQIARVYCKYGEQAFSEEELSLLYQAATEKTLHGYNPVQADEIKNYTNFDIVWDNKWGYLQLWLETGLRHPGEYLLSLLENTYQAWYPWTSVIDDVETGQIYYFDYEMRGDFLEREPHLEWLYDFYVKLASQISYQKIPVVRLLFSIGAMFWVVLTTWFYGIYVKNRGIIWAFLLVLLYCLTAMLGPVSLVRYYLILFYGFPVSITFLVGSGRKKSTIETMQQIECSSSDNVQHKILVDR